MKNFKNYINEDPGWGTETRRAMYRAACKYLDIDLTQADNIFVVGLNSILQSNSVELTGNILDEVKKDSAFLLNEDAIIKKIKNDIRYKNKREFSETSTFPTQLGGQRARGEMWKQALQFWKWRTKYSATWEMAFNELTWTVRSVNIKYHYVVSNNGKITITYSFSDTLDLRPSWGNRSMEYNAICTVLGFMYHDIIGGSDELQIKATWQTKLY